jgi:hypothetical protein
MDVLVSFIFPNTFQIYYNAWIWMPGTGFTSPGISNNPSRVWSVQHIMFEKPVKTWASVGYRALANVKSYSQVVKSFSAKRKQGELEINQFRFFFCLDLIHYPLSYYKLYFLTSSSSCLTLPGCFSNQLPIVLS